MCVVWMMCDVRDVSDAYGVHGVYDVYDVCDVYAVCDVDDVRIYLSDIAYSSTIVYDMNHICLEFEDEHI